MSVVKDIRLSVIAETAKYRQEIAKTGSYTERQLNAASLSFAREATKAQAQAAKAAKTAAKDSAGYWQGAGKAMQLAIGAAGIGGAVTAGRQLVGVFRDVASYVSDAAALTDKLNTAAQGSGMSLEMVNALRIAAAQSGKALEDLVPRDLAKRMDDLQRGTSEAAHAFGLIGKAQADIAGLSVDETYRLIVRELYAMEDAGQRAAAAQLLLGDQGKQALSAFADGADTLDAYVAQSERSIVASEDAVRATGEWQAATASLQLLVEEMAASLLVATSNTGALTAATETFSSVAVPAMEAVYRSVAQVNRSIDGMYAAWDRMTTIDPMTGLTLGLSNLYAGVQDARATIRLAEMDTRNFFEAFNQGITEIGGGEMEAPVRTVERMSEATKKATRNVQDHRDVLLEQADAYAKQAQLAQRYADEQHAELGRLRKAEQSLAQLRTTFNREQLDEEGQIKAAYADRIMQLNQIESALGRTAATADLRYAMERRLSLDLHELQGQQLEAAREREVEAQAERLAEQQQYWGEVSTYYGMAADAVNGLIGLVSQLTQQQLDGHRANVQAARSSASERARLEADLQRQILDSVSEEERARLESHLAQVESARARDERIASSEQEAAIRAWRRQRNLALVQTTINSAASLMAGYAQYGPPPSPMGIAVTISNAAAHALATGVILGTRPPQFDAGFPGYSIGPTNYTATLDRGEGVANRRAVGALGGPEGMDHLNRTGELPQGGQGGVTELHVDGRAMGAWIASEIRRGRELTRVLKRSGSRTGVRPQRVW